MTLEKVANELTNKSNAIKFWYYFLFDRFQIL